MFNCQPLLIVAKYQNISGEMVVQEFILTIRWQVEHLLAPFYSSLCFSLCQKLMSEKAS